MPGGYTRRALLLGAVAAMSAGCANASSQGSRSPARETAGPPATAAPTPTPPPSPTATPPAPQVDPAAVSERFSGATARQWGLFVDGVVNELPIAHAGAAPLVGLTLDACGGSSGSGIDTELLNLLIAEGIPATLFLNSRWIHANRSLAEQLAAVPHFELANHGTDHRPLSISGRSAYGIPGTASVDEVVAEVWGNHQTLTELTGRPPRWFRSGTAHYDEVAVAIVEALGERVIGFTVNGDGGATYGPATVAAEVGAAAPGGIVIAHMNRPGSGTAAGLAMGIAELRAVGFRFALLDGDLRARG